jgi:hypothetical protein
MRISRKKTNEEKDKNTIIIWKRVAMNYGFVVKASDDVPVRFLEEHGIPSDGTRG